jgi:hypothetical protein
MAAPGLLTGLAIRSDQSAIAPPLQPVGSKRVPYKELPAKAWFGDMSWSPVGHGVAFLVGDCG